MFIRFFPRLPILESVMILHYLCLTFCSLSLSFFLAALKDGGSCSSSKSMVMNSSKVRALLGVSPNSISLNKGKNQESMTMKMDENYVCFKVKKSWKISENRSVLKSECLRSFDEDLISRKLWNKGEITLHYSFFYGRFTIYGIFQLKISGNNILAVHIE